MAGVNTGYRVRRMSEWDVPAVMELERAMFPADAWHEELLRSELAESIRHYFVACSRGGTAAPGDTAVDDRDGPIVGYAGLRAVPPRGDVQTIAVDRPWWGRGIGRALLTELLGQAYSRGVREVYLEVRSDNPRARDLYRAFGFAQIGVRAGYYHDGADAIVMCCAAPAAAIAGTGGGEPGEALEFGEAAETAGDDEEKA